MGEEELAKDLGMFDIELVGLKPPSNSQNTKSFAMRPSTAQPLSQKNVQGNERRLCSKLQGVHQGPGRMVGQKRKRSIDDEYARLGSNDLKEELLEDRERNQGSKSPSGSADRFRPQSDEHSLFGPVVNKTGEAGKAGYYQRFKQAQSYQ